MARDTSDLLHGTLDLLVLKAVATQPLHGFGHTNLEDASAIYVLETV